MRKMTLEKRMNLCLWASAINLGIGWASRAWSGILPETFLAAASFLLALALLVFVLWRVPPAESMEFYVELRNTFVRRAAVFGALLGISILGMVILSWFDRSKMVITLMSIALMLAPVRIVDLSLLKYEQA